MTLSVDLLENGVGQNKDKNIQIRLSGEDIKFIATEYSISLFIDEEMGDKLAFQINSLLQEVERKKT